ncbi:hypothetical protein AFV8_gp60 [Betalipothrixvirus puteoliense]|uniref:Uncharacterized protein n=1 Tax=Betalipothrixvirus puteoliense TaxID=346884 RepID=A7WKS9_9VIRU|nr:hypothetical protein AFV8_gp60 [Acidianus filamentous virus 8]CAL69584.1 conserved hypothetical protein [Acidianus filamentous virus 8]
MLPTDVVADVIMKLPFMKKVYSLLPYYYSIDYLLPYDIVNLMNNTFHDLLLNDPSASPKFDGYVFKEIYDLVNEWNSISLQGALIYRGTSVDYVENNNYGFYTSNGIVHLVGGNGYLFNLLVLSSRFCSFALLLDAPKPVILVAKYDPKYCAPDDYFLVRSVIISVLSTVSFYNLLVRIQIFEREMRGCVRYKFPVSNTLSSKIKGRDLLELFDMVVPVYREVMNEERIKDMRKKLEAKV